MPKKITPLSEVKVRTAKPQEGTYKIFDGGGLFLLVTPSGGKLSDLLIFMDVKDFPSEESEAISIKIIAILKEGDNVKIKRLKLFLDEFLL